MSTWYFSKMKVLLVYFNKHYKMALTLTIFFPKLSKHFISKITNVSLHGLARAQTKTIKLSTIFFQNKFLIVLKFINMLNSVISWKFYP